MSMNPNEPAHQRADDNPYAPPQARIGGEGSAEAPSDIAEAEAIRRRYLSHEASVKSIGSLHYLGVITGVIGLGLTVIRGLSQGRETDEGIGSAAFVATIVYLFAVISINLALGIGLSALKSWARWTEVVLTTLGLLIYSLGTAGLVVVAQGRGAVGPVIAASLVISLILCYILYLLLSKKGSMVFSPEYQLIIERTPHIKYRTSWIVKGCLIVLVAVIGIGIIAALLSTGR